MKGNAWGVGIVIVAVAAVAAVGHWVGNGDGLGAADAWAAPPPLKVDKSAPLLLDEPEPPAEPGFDDVPPGPMADNSACFVCHTNYREEPMALSHAKVNVGCVKCHGPSYAHRNDEDNVTPPDVMYWPERIEEGCAECHDKHDVPPDKVIARWQQCCPAKTDAAKIVCTDCHGQHRLAFRTVWWDKKTGKLVVRPQGQRIKVRPDLKKEAATEPPAEGS